LLAAFPVYRTYVTEETTEIPPAQREYIQTAFQKALERHPELQPACEFIRDILLLQFPFDFDGRAQNSARDFILRFQQLSGPATAKGVEDTAFYNYHRLVSLNEVGSEPSDFGLTREQFHAHNRTVAEWWPHSLLATSTHDTKRGEDTRARINVLSEMPQRWQAAIEQWRSLNASGKTHLPTGPAPDANDEYLLYQTLLGTWPPKLEIEADREFLTQKISDYMLKAVRESKAHTSWTEADPVYERAVTGFVRHTLRPGKNEFLESFRPLQQDVSWFGHLNSLSQALLKLTSPGVPDLYQGTELWDLSLVDPDNRRPVDYGARRKFLSDIKRDYADSKPALLNNLLQNWSTGALKLFLIWRVLRHRAKHGTLFAKSHYVPLAIEGARSRHVCAFLRFSGGEGFIVVAPRLVYSLCARQRVLPLGEAVWADTRVVIQQPSAGSYVNIITGEPLPRQAIRGEQLLLSAVLSRFPVALLAFNS
jgi:(1->4)-alpha-D-glucan 1-alpha-D-glucosylmutase